MQNKEYVSLFLDAFIKVLGKLSSETYAYFLLRNVMGNIKTDVGSIIEVSNQIKIKDNINKLAISDIKTFIADLNIEFKTQVGSNTIFNKMIKEVKDELGENYKEFKKDNIIF